MAIKVDLSYGNLFRLAVALISVAMVIYHVWAIAFGSPEAFHFRGTHLLFAMTLVFLLYRRSGDAEGLPTPLDYVLLVLGAAGWASWRQSQRRPFDSAQGRPELSASPARMVD